MKFTDQNDAGSKLLEILPRNELKANNFLILCLNIKSVIMCDFVARGLDLGYEILFSEDIKTPNNDECDIACVSESEDVVINEALRVSFEITKDYIYGRAKKLYEEKILKNVYKYRKGGLLSPLKDRNILLITDSCETGARLAVATKSLTNMGAKSVILGIALMPSDMAEYANTIVDDVYCAFKIDGFVSTDFYYEKTLDNDENAILKILEDSPYYLPLKKQGVSNAN
ncbi:putative phosphoribosyltransferase [Candidatus Campylobacter infans]|uniref:Putative phosphoribosyltransferase n=1 Tax=Candidatus Campylobacter infans TaxID=2561898 RepID=A0A7H9CIP4_9BACT|nr:sodium:proton antiporter [Candidatus Campylobacter infans]QLI05987.1 putative phosphoribosyltransferase [Candidatus Campylobacter infans]